MIGTVLTLVVAAFLGTALAIDAPLWRALQPLHGLPWDLIAAALATVIALVALGLCAWSLVRVWLMPSTEDGER